MKKRNQMQQQIHDIRNETDSSAILNDVVNSEFEQYPGQNERITNDSPLSEQEEIVQNNTDGKTWITRGDRRY